MKRKIPASFQGKKNIYTCPTCQGHIVTVDTDHGVTPFMIPCKATPTCIGMMESSSYRVQDQRMAAAYEWYSPGVVEQAGLPCHLHDHVKKGGLLIRSLADHDLSASHPDNQKKD